MKKSMEKKLKNMLINAGKKSTREIAAEDVHDLFEDYLIEQKIPKECILHMNLESLKYRKILDYEAFYDYVEKQFVQKEKNYLLIDELQAVS